MMRNTGGAIGISYLTDMLVNREQIHQAHLVHHLTVFEAWRLSHSAPRVPRGFHLAPLMTQLTRGQKQSLDFVYSSIQAQAAILSFNDIYRLLTLITVLMVPSFIFFKQPAPVDSHSTH